MRKKRLPIRCHEFATCFTHGQTPCRGTPARGKHSFEARCSACHVAPTFSEPGWNLHTARELGIDDFQANRSPTRAYRTAPLQGLWTHMKGGFYHDGRFATLQAVVEHYDRVLGLNLSAQQQRDLIEYLKSL